MQGYYVGDICVASIQVEKLKEAVKKTEDFMQASGMKVKHAKKCGVLHGRRRSGKNNWYKNDKTG